MLGKIKKLFSNRRVYLEEALGRDLLLEGPEILNQGRWLVAHQGAHAKRLELSTMTRIAVECFENVSYISAANRIH